MVLTRNTYGKGRVRIMRVARGERQAVRELSVRVMLEGGFERAFTHGDNRQVVATDTIKNIVNIVAREQIDAAAEPFGVALVERFLQRYPQIERVSVLSHETGWRRMTVDGQPHPHSFLLDGNGQPTACVVADRARTVIRSGIEGFTFMKCTASGWVDFVRDDVTTLPDTDDRIAATSMTASWLWRTQPAEYEAANALVLETMMRVFATTYSFGIQDSLYRMGEAALAAVPELAEIDMACPNKHYLPINLAAFGMQSDNQIFTPTDEPHGQIECTVARD